MVCEIIIIGGDGARMGGGIRVARGPAPRHCCSKTQPSLAKLGRALYPAQSGCPLALDTHDPLRASHTRTLGKAACCNQAGFFTPAAANDERTALPPENRDR